MSESNICFFECSLQEWILEEYDNTVLKFTFLGRTLDLDVSFEDEEKIKNIQLSSQISGMVKHQSYSIMEHFRLFFFSFPSSLLHFFFSYFSRQYTSCNTWSSVSDGEIRSLRLFDNVSYS